MTITCAPSEKTRRACCAQLPHQANRSFSELVSFIIRPPTRVCSLCCSSITEAEICCTIILFCPMMLHYLLAIMMKNIMSSARGSGNQRPIKIIISDVSLCIRLLVRRLPYSSDVVFAGITQQQLWLAWSGSGRTIASDITIYILVIISFHSMSFHLISYLKYNI